MEDRQCRSDAGSSRLEFKDEAVKMVIETARPIAEIARDIHVNEGTLGNWVHKRSSTSTTSRR
jgi:transposase-like protein